MLNGSKRWGAVSVEVAGIPDFFSYDIDGFRPPGLARFTASMFARSP